ncbi:hypothetical protein AK830_g8474 [Neonectria ditissima]|uniref:Uncharacterized protein n=1 Tax=Neonectria ditissima TaxID=78410 RepID=A0A0P7AKF0_9HYPO|nr:hypothetical protein AK830_g8474 [Neonectria ditissima]
MKPSLTTGLFMNGRSSTNPNALTDLVFNDMGFLQALRGTVAQEEVGLGVQQRPCDSVSNGLSQDRRPHSEDQLSRTERHSSTTHATPTPYPPPNNSFQRSNDNPRTTDHRGSEGEPQGKQPQRSDLRAPTRNSNINKSPTLRRLSDNPTHSQENQPRAMDVQSFVSSSPIPEYITQALIQTRVFDGMGAIHNKATAWARNQKSQGEPGTETLRQNPDAMTATTHAPICNDKGVTEFLRSQSSRQHPREPPPQDASLQYIEDNNTQAWHLHDSTRSSAEVDFNTGRFQDRAGSATSRKSQDAAYQPATLAGSNANEAQARLNLASETFPKTADGGTGIVHSLVQDEENNEYTQPRFWQRHPFSQSSTYATTAPRYRECTEETIPPFRYGPRVDSPSWWTSQPSQQPEAPSRPPEYFGFLAPRTWGQTETLRTIDEEASLNGVLRFPVHSGANETMKEFIERIEAETLLDWDETQHLPEGIDHEGGQDNESREAQYFGRGGSEDLDMASFWRPNYFI